MKRISSIVVTGIMLAAFLVPHEHHHEDGVKHECTACVFHQEHQSAAVDTTEAMPVPENSEHPVFHFILHPLLHSEQTPGVPRAPPVPS